MYRDTKEAKLYITWKKNVDKYYDQFGSDDTYIEIESKLAKYAAEKEHKIFAASAQDGITLEELIKKGL